MNKRIKSSNQAAKNGFVVSSNSTNGTVTEVNGSGTHTSLGYNVEYKNDTNEDNDDDGLTLQVVLPSGAEMSHDVKKSVQMLDLLVYLAARCKISPSDHALQVLDSGTGKQVNFKPHQTIGSVGTGKIIVVPKGKSRINMGRSQSVKLFEITMRFTINLPGAQKTVMRISPQQTLSQVFDRVCNDRGLDRSLYAFQYSQEPAKPVDVSASIANCRLTEINLIHVRGLPVADSIQLLSDHHQSCHANSHADTPEAASAGISMPIPVAVHTSSVSGRKSFFSFLKKERTPDNVSSAGTTDIRPRVSGQQHSVCLRPKRDVLPSAAVCFDRSSIAELPTTCTASVQSSRPKSMYVALNHVSNGNRDGLVAQELPMVKSNAVGAMKKKRRAPLPPSAASAPDAPSLAAPAFPLQEENSALLNNEIVGAAPDASTVMVSLSNDTRVDPDLLSPRKREDTIVAPAAFDFMQSCKDSEPSGYHGPNLSGSHFPDAIQPPTEFSTSKNSPVSPVESPWNRESDPSDRQSSLERMSIAKKREDSTAGERSWEASLPVKRRKAPPPPPSLEQQTNASVRPTSDHGEITLPDTASSTVVEGEGKSPLWYSTTENVGDTPVPVSLSDIEKTANNFESHDIVPGDGEADLGNDEFNINDILDAIKCDHTSMNDYDAYCDAFTIVSDENGVGVGGMEAATAVSTGDGGCKEDDAYVTGARPCKFVPPPPPEQPPSPLEDVLPVAEYAEMGTLVMDDGTSLTEETISVRTFLSVGEVLQDDLHNDDDIGKDCKAEVLSLEKANDIPTPLVASAEWQVDHARSSSSVPLHNSTDLYLLGGLNPSNSPHCPVRLSCTDFVTDDDGIKVVTTETLPPPLQFQSDSLQDGEQRHGLTCVRSCVAAEDDSLLYHLANISGFRGSAVDMTDRCDCKAAQPSTLVHHACLESFHRQQNNEVTGMLPSDVGPVTVDALPVSVPPPSKEVFVFTSTELSNIRFISPPPTPSAIFKSPVVTSSEGTRQQSAESGSDTLADFQAAQTDICLQPVCSSSFLAGTSSTSSISDTGQPSSVDRLNPLFRFPCMRASLQMEFSPFSGIGMPFQLSGPAHNSMADLDLSCRISQSASSDVVSGEHHPSPTACIIHPFDADDGCLDDNDDGCLDDNDDCRSCSDRVSMGVGFQPDLQQPIAECLENQLSFWQRQLLENQVLLATLEREASSSGNGSSSILKVQMQTQVQMQQLMMQQLTDSISSISQQNMLSGGSVDASEPASSVCSQRTASNTRSAQALPVPYKTQPDKSMGRAVISDHEPQLDPREELMIAIRSFNGHQGFASLIW